jgi:hypothetical protein
MRRRRTRHAQTPGAAYSGWHYLKSNRG